MESLKIFLIISLICHGVVYFMIIYIHPDNKLDISQIYQVSILNNIPQGGGSEQERDSFSQEKKSVGNISEHATLDEVEKEQSLQDNNSAIENQSKTNTGSPPQFIGQTEGASYIPGRGDPYEIVLWKTRARSLVETLWKSLPEDTKVKTSLQTTYLLMVSRTGEVLDKKLLISSGNETFDQSILLALSKITRFPPPPLVLIAGDDSINIPMSFYISQNSVF